MDSEESYSGVLQLWVSLMLSRITPWFTGRCPDDPGVLVMQ